MRLPVRHNISCYFLRCSLIVGLKRRKSSNHNEPPKLIVNAAEAPTQHIGTCAIFASFNVEYKISIKIDFDSVVTTTDIKKSKLISSAFEERSCRNIDTIRRSSIGDINSKIGTNSYYRVKMCSWNALYFPFLPTRNEVVDNNVCSPVARMILNGKFFAKGKLRLNRINAISGITDAECKNS